MKPSKEEKLYGGGSENFGKQFRESDVIGVFLDLIDKTISKFPPPACVWLFLALCDLAS